MASKSKKQTEQTEQAAPEEVGDEATEQEVPAMVRIAVPPGIGEILISIGGDVPLRYREVEQGIIEVPETEVELFLQHVSGSSIEPAAPAEEE